MFKMYKHNFLTLIIKYVFLINNYNPLYAKNVIYFFLQLTTIINVLYVTAFISLQ